MRTLLATNNGEYTAACALDFEYPPFFYDSFATRDIDGNPALLPSWPYFLAQKSYGAILSNSPAPVRSCWNSLVAFDADAFYGAEFQPFRAIQDSLASKHLEGSEGCLIHADNDFAEDKGVWVNPKVRVAYNEKADKVVNPGNQNWPTHVMKVRLIWKYRWVRWTGWPWRYVRDWKLAQKVREWKDDPKAAGEEDHVEPGVFCLADEMHILPGNGRKHV